MQHADTTPVLIADDDENDLYLVISAFEQAHLRCPLMTVRNGAQAVDYISGSGEFGNRAEHPLPGLVLMDIKMPVMGGLEALEWLHDHGLMAELKVIVLSGSSLPGDVEKARALGAAAYRVKPSSFSDYVKLAEEIRDKWLDPETCGVKSGKDVEFFRG